MLIGDIIAERRDKLDITQEGLAEKAEISQTHISRIERNKDKPSLKLLERLAQALQCSLYIDLIPDGEEPPKPSQAHVTALRQQAVPASPSIMEMTASLNERLKHEYESLSHHEKVAIEGLLASCMATIQQENHADVKAG